MARQKLKATQSKLGAKATAGLGKKVKTHLPQPPQPVAGAAKPGISKAAKSEEPKRKLRKTFAKKAAKKSAASTPMRPKRRTKRGIVALRRVPAVPGYQQRHYD